MLPDELLERIPNRTFNEYWALYEMEGHAAMQQILADRAKEGLAKVKGKWQ